MKIGVIGAGAWGTALAIAATRAGSEVVLWSRRPQIVDDINRNRFNSKYLGGIQINKNITATLDIADVNWCDAILLVVPAQQLRGVCEKLGSIDKKVPFVICAKGVEHDSFALMSDVFAEYFPGNPVLILSGPNFADEVAKGLPACATLACEDKNAADKVISGLGSSTMRLYYSDDVIGAQIGGAIKNVIAIACGVAIGRGLGENARAALVTRGLAEIGRLCKKMGGKQETLLGLSGIGDIMLTCGSEKSRNTHFGIELGRGIKLEDVLAEGKTVEGVVTSKSVSMLADRLGVDMPISKAVKAILFDNAGIAETIKTLLERPFTDE